MRRARRIELLLLVATVGACDEGGPSGPSAEASSSGEELAETDTEEFSCGDQPVITYETFGRGFLATYCNGCHGGKVSDRGGAPESVVFDDAAQTLALLDRIEARVFPEQGMAPMPPAGGIAPDDAERARIWLTCFP